MSSSTRTLILLALGAGTLIALAVISLRNDPVPVDLAQVTRGRLEVTVNADGTARVRDLYEVAAPIAGTALRSPVEVGDPVTKGETIVAIVQPASVGLLDARARLQAEAALQEAQAARHVAQADLVQARETQAFAQAQFDRTQALVTRGVASVTRLEVDAQQLAVARAGTEAAQARVDMADGAVDRARATLLDPAQSTPVEGSCCVELRAPADGVVLSVAAMSRRPVTIGAPLVSIGNPDDLELVADILSHDAVRLPPGARAYVERWGGPQVLQAQLDRIDPSARTKVSALGIEEQRVDAYFTLTSPHAARPGLGDGFSVFLRIVVWEADDVVQIPLSAAFRSGEDWAVFVANGDVAEKRLVKLGRRNARQAEVQAGLVPGERVVTHPSDAITDGARLVERTQL